MESSLLHFSFKNRFKIVLSTNGSGYPHAKRMNLDPYLTAYTKWIKDLNIRLKNLRKTHLTKFYKPGLGNDCLGATPETKEIKRKTNKLDYIKIKYICTSKGTIEKVQRQPPDRDSIYKSFLW